MNIRQLEAFRAVMIAHTTKGAAELLGLSQPAVSRLVDALERGLQLPLFDRRRNRLHPTPEAALLFEEVERTFSSVDRIRALATDIREASAGRLTLAALPALAFGLLPAAVGEFKARHPRTAVAVQVQTSARIEELAAAQQIDFGLAEHPFSRTGIAVEPFSQAPMRLALPWGHPLARRGLVTARELAGQDLVVLGTTSACRRRLDLECQRAGVTPRIAVEVQYTALVARFVALGLGVGLVDPFTALGEGVAGVETVAFAPAIPFEVGLLHPSQRPLSRAAREFLGLLRRHRARVLGPQLQVAPVNARQDASENAQPAYEGAAPAFAAGRGEPRG